MFTDYKQTPIKNKKRNNGSGTTWMLSGIILGLTVGVVLYKVSSHITDQQSPRLSQAEQTNAAAEVEEMTSEVNNDKPERPEFAYHAILPKLEVPVDEDYSAYLKDVANDNGTANNDSTLETAELNTDTKHNGLNSFTFQVASYRDMQSAQSAQDRLSKKGIATTIQPATVKGLQWFRVITVAIALEDVNVVENAIQTFGYNPIKRRIQ